MGQLGRFAPYSHSEIQVDEDSAIFNMWLSAAAHSFSFQWQKGRNAWTSWQKKILCARLETGILLPLTNS